MFAVFGVTKQVARRVAEKKTPRTITVNRKKIERTDEQLVAAIDEAAQAYFERMKPVILSPEYSSPSFAADFMDLVAPEDARALEVRIRVPVKKVIKGKEKVVRRWLSWNPDTDYLAA
ncbi:hypothetical protein [Aliidiomarina maris]|uniref:Uncharacterized protein n=1 Tax=Aliidiomarina maris TaxID=531312 RepID=A0A327XBL6_9GAMM|nr:hypothetical protein [Aliidiomarina maris]RAK01646.1 hypothetical protein B0I24_101269 [Aliidiomarina maris]RUO28470.1 hypothetical protein CWE07_01285 [Aliidiomarina maris]